MQYLHVKQDVSGERRAGSAPRLVERWVNKGGGEERQVKDGVRLLSFEQQ